ncbi:hypothetical protein [Gordonia shandongensis]|uniref:hypothetical protein n=1 Tax=Gordonia shandongensis TaxID=376351 RepID=UPI0012EB70D8|nr:hypothetical protein [Gordonia shandongensis]
MRRPKKTQAKSEADAPEPDETETDESEPDEGGTDQTGADQTGADQTDTAQTDTAETDTGETDTGESGTGESGPDPEELSANAGYRERRRANAVVRRSAGRGSLTPGGAVAVVASALGVLVLVAGIVLSVVFVVQYDRIQDKERLRAEYSSFAQQMVVSMTTLTSSNADQLEKNLTDKTSGRARQMFEENMKAITEMARRDDSVSTTTIVSDAVSKADDNEGSVLVVFAWEEHPRDDPKNTQFETFRARVDITRINGELKMTYFDWVA